MDNSREREAKKRNEYPLRSLGVKKRAARNERSQKAETTEKK